MNRHMFNSGYAAYRAEDWAGALACFSGSDPRSRIAQAYVWMNRTDGKAAPEKAFDIFQELAEQGDPIGCTDLGFCFCYGIGCVSDQAKAFRWYEKAAKMGFPRAMNNLAVCYIQGLGVEPDPQKAVEWLEKTGADSDGMILCNLGSAYAAVGDRQKATLCYRKAAAQGDPKAIDHLRQWGENVSAFTAVEPDLDAVLFGELAEN